MDKIQIYSRSRSDTLQSDQNFLFRKLTRMKEMKEMTPPYCKKWKKWTPTPKEINEMSPHNLKEMKEMTPHIVKNERNEPQHPKK